MLAEQVDYPLHLGVTEAGTPGVGTIKSAVGIGTLLAEGIGDTIRVSLSSDPTEEVRVGIDILKALGLRQGGLTFVSCPSCGRADVDLVARLHPVKYPSATRSRSSTSLCASLGMDWIAACASTTE